jgi:flagellar biosynthesis/type III secretory pathway chaperone
MTINNMRMIKRKQRLKRSVDQQHKTKIKRRWESPIEKDYEKEIVINNRRKQLGRVDD